MLIIPVNRSFFFYSMSDKNAPWPRKMCYTYNHNNKIYIKHSGHGSVGTTAASSLATRNRI